MNNEIKETGMFSYTVGRLWDGWLEFRDEQGKRAKDAHKSLRVTVLAERKDYQIISLKQLLEYKDEDLISKKADNRFKEDFKLYRFEWKPFQEIGKTLTFIEKTKNGNKRGKQNRSKL